MAIILHIVGNCQALTMQYLYYGNACGNVARMKIACLRDEFRCMTLEPSAKGDLRVLFDAKLLLFKDKSNDDVGRHRTAILAAMDSEGHDYFDLMFSNPDHAHFVLLGAEDEIVGSSAVFSDDKQGVALFASSHIHPDFRGNRLVDLFYQARENHVRANTDCTTIRLSTLRYNNASQKAAKRNEFIQSYKYRAGYYLFEKTL